MPNKVNVIVGRFQVAELHQGHIDMINHFDMTCDHLIIFLGHPFDHKYFTEKNPIPFYHRKQMILEQFPKAQILPISDYPNNDLLWVKNLDEMVKENLRSNEYAMMCGSRDSFLHIYKNSGGKHATVAYHNELYSKDESGTNQREQIKHNHFHNSLDFRKGIIYSVTNSKL